MPRSSASRVSGRDTLYTEITQAIIAQLEAGCAPWVQPWDGACAAPVGLPRNAATGRCYSGINILILWNAVIRHGYPSQRWLTFRQALAMGGHVRKGARGVTVVFASRFTPDHPNRNVDVGETPPKQIAFLKRFTVFNVAQCENLPEDSDAASACHDLIEPAVQRVIDHMGIDFRVGGAHAFYAPRHDFVQIPALQHFPIPLDWSRTALHELSHATGHTTRLGRDLTGTFGSPKYAFEELIAEMSAAFACAALGIEPSLRHGEYLQSWLNVLREDNRAIVRAASQASKAADFLLRLCKLSEDSASNLDGKDAAGGCHAHAA